MSFAIASSGVPGAESRLDATGAKASDATAAASTARTPLGLVKPRWKDEIG
jgi:hypothetical protein